MDILSLIFGKTQDNKSEIYEDDSKEQGRKSECKRCHSISALESDGYCNACHNLKKRIDYLYSGEAKNPQKLVDKLIADFAYDRKKMESRLDHSFSAALTYDERKIMAGIDGKSADYFIIPEKWSSGYFVDINYIMAKFLQNDYVEISKQKPLITMNVPELRAVLKFNGKSTNGNKKTLIERIKLNIPIDRIEASLGNKDFFILTDKGKKVAIWPGVISEEVEMEKNCLSLILEDQLEDAYSLVLDYEARQTKKRGIGELPLNPNTFLRIGTVLPFELPEALKNYETQLKASVIYCGMMGSSKTSTFFLSLVDQKFSPFLLKPTIQALTMMYLGITLPNGFSINNDTPETAPEIIDFDAFLETFLKKAKTEGLDINVIAWNAMRDNTINFTYKKDYQIGRVQFGKKTSRMQILTKDYVEWKYNKTLEDYISYLDYWINMCKEYDNPSELDLLLQEYEKNT